MIGCGIHALWSSQLVGTVGAPIWDLLLVQADFSARTVGPPCVASFQRSFPRDGSPERQITKLRAAAQPHTMAEGNIGMG